MDIQVISFHCTLKNKLGHVLSSTFNHDVLTSGNLPSHDQLRGLSEGLRNLRAGEKRSIALTADQAYGYYDTGKVITKSREDFPENEEVKIGDEIYIKNAKGQVHTYRVIYITDDVVGMDGNHPLAGQDLIFEIEALQVREATPEEIFESEPNSTPQLTFH